MDSNHTATLVLTVSTPHHVLSIEDKCRIIPSAEVMMNPIKTLENNLKKSNDVV